MLPLTGIVSRTAYLLAAVLLLLPAGSARAACGDVNSDGAVDSTDSASLRQALALAPAGLPAAENCNVYGPSDATDADGNGLPDECDILDSVVLERDLDGLEPGINDDCSGDPVAADTPSANGGAGKQEPARDGDDADAVVVHPTQGSTILNTGEERLRREDLRVSGRGEIHFSMERTYRSRLSYDGPLGHAWDFAYNERLYVAPNGDVTRSNGRGHVDLWTVNPDGSYDAPAGFFATLIKEPSGEYIYREADGFKRFFGTNGELRAHEDRTGNRLEVTYDGAGNLSRVIDAYGRSFRFTFETQPDGVDRLVRLSDFAGRSVVYAYDADGNLASVTSPRVVGTSTGNDFPQGRTEAYTYSSGQAHPWLDHNLLTIKRAEEVATAGPVSLALSYGSDPADPASFDRVLTRVEGGTNASGIPAGGTTTFAYTSLNEATPPGSPGLPRMRVIVTERNGNQFYYFVDELGHGVTLRRYTRGLRLGEPDFFESDFEYDADGSMTRQLLPAGNEIRYVYDSSGPRGAQKNLLEQRRIADAGRGGGPDLVTTRTYEPLFNQLLSSTDPRGNSPGFVPPLGTATPDRYTRRIFYDYQEGNDPVPEAVQFGIDLTGVPRNLGDINDDGVTNQIAGNRIRREAPAVALLPGSNEALRIGGTSQTIVTEKQWNDRGQLLSTVDAEGNRTSFSYYPESDPDGDGSPVPGETSLLARGYLMSFVSDALPAPARRTTASPPAEQETRVRYDAVGNVIARRNPRGVETSYEVNALDEIVVTTRGADISEAIATGELITGESAFGYRKRFYYDHNGRLVQSENENAATVSTTAGVGDWVSRTFEYDILDNLLESTVEIDATTTEATQYRYDANELRVEVTRPEGNVARTDYDERNRVFRVHRGFGTTDVSTERFDYDANGNLLTRTDAEDNDGDGAPEQVGLTYDGFDRRVATTDALGNQILMTYDPASNIVRKQRWGHAANSPTSSNVLLSDSAFSFDERNRIFQTDHELFLADGFFPLRPEDLRDDNSDGKVTNRTEYDALSRATFVVEDDGDTTQSVYDGVGRAVERIDALGNRLLRSFDQNGNLLERTSIEISPAGLVPDEAFTTRYAYDQLDRLVRIVDNSGRTSRFGFDSRDNPTTSSDAVGATLAADPLGQFPGAINGPGNTRTVHYDGSGRRVREVTDLRVGGVGSGSIDLSNPANPDGQITMLYEYDQNSNLISFTDDNGNATAYGYDELDRQTSQTNADGTQFLHTYDRDGNRRTTIDPAGNAITNTFDALNRLVQRQIVRAPGFSGTTLESYGYDGLSRLTYSSDNNGSASRTHEVERFFDSLSRLLEEQEDFEPHSSIWSGDGNRIILVYPTTRVLGYEYDAANRIVNVGNPLPVPLAGSARGAGGAAANTAPVSPSVAEYDWIGPGPCSVHCPCEDPRTLLLAMGNGTEMSLLDDAGTTDTGWDDSQDMIALRHLFGTTTLVDREYTYNRASICTSELLGDYLGGPTDLYEMDSAYRVTSTTLAADAAPESFSTVIEYDFDGVGNRLRVDFTQDFGGGVIVGFGEDYVGNLMNEYDEVGGGGPRGHDANGNLTSANGFTYVYDYRNRLVEVRRSSDAALRAAYEYDTLNRRVRKKLFDLASPGTLLQEVRYLHDEWNVIEEWGDLADYDENGPLATYLYGPGIDQPIQMDTSVSTATGEASFFYHRDRRHSIVAMTDSAGTVVERTRYDDYGNFVQPISIGNPYLFQGRRYDPETGLYYFRSRYLDPLTGRFLQRDPIWDARNMGNQYTFARNSPLAVRDPFGTYSFSDLWTDAELVVGVGLTLIGAVVEAPVIVAAGVAVGVVAVAERINGETIGEAIEGVIDARDALADAEAMAQANEDNARASIQAEAIGLDIDIFDLQGELAELLEEMQRRREDAQANLEAARSAPPWIKCGNTLTRDPDHESRIRAAEQALRELEAEAQEGVAAIEAEIAAIRAEMDVNARQAREAGIDMTNPPTPPEVPRPRSGNYPSMR